MAYLMESGYGQLEINNCAFRRDGRIEAQCKLGTDFNNAVAQNGMVLAVDNTTRTLSFPTGSDELLALNYSAEHIYDERTPGLKNFALGKKDFLPRLGYLSVGDKFTTNTVNLGSGTYASISLGDVFKPGTDGFWVADASTPVGQIQAKVVEKTTMPDGQPALKFQIIKTI